MKNETSKKRSATNIFHFFSKSLQNKILFPILLLIIFAGGAVSFISYYYSVKNTTTELTNNVESQMESIDNTFEMFFSNIESTLNRLITNDLLVKYKRENYRDILTYFEETQATNEYIANIYTGIAETDDMIIYPVANFGEDYHIKEREWYINAAEANGETVWTEPYTDAATGETVITASKAYYDGDRLVGVTSIDVSLTTLIELVNNIEIGETGFAVLYDQTGKYMTHPNDEYIGKDASGQSYFQHILDSGDQGIVRTEMDGEEQIIGFVKNATTDWIIGGFIPVKELQEKGRSVIAPILISFFIVTVIALVSSLMLAKSITKPIRTIMERMKVIGDGNLSAESLTIQSKDEIGEMAKAINQMQNNLKELVYQISAASNHIVSHSEELTHSANEVKSGSEQIATTMQELASGSETQANSASDLSARMNALTTDLSLVNESGEEMEHTSEEVIGLSNRGSQLMNHSREQMNNIDDTVKKAVNKVKELDSYSQSITKMVTVIKDVADQTNLLSLNASIEAARAGEYGKGFAVVAEEIRKLAEQSAQSVSEINDLVGRIQGGTLNVVKSLEDGYEEVQKGTVQIKETQETFDEINQSVEEMVQNIQQITSRIANIASNSKEMNNAIQEVAAVSEEASAGIEQTSASSQQISGSMEEVTVSSAQLVQLAEELNEAIRQFKL
ncbi:methyl-accepting chemotaxis protein TlpA [Compostibacillus humi]|uniref:Methyl-accepting chemotaxis protein TlpA n=1 Tax=Compostibacillus humi TaxID=1245525 RepID=A0A8J2TNJ3_9BACI|nr:methyl-accepting chemotaxis protein [Compostibacillus humi]GFZ80744.1 methyl-accepting chemotaxis protein TlpA [Compostibacillus humi]